MKNRVVIVQIDKPFLQLVTIRCHTVETLDIRSNYIDIKSIIGQNMVL